MRLTVTGRANYPAIEETSVNGYGILLRHDSSLPLEAHAPGQPEMGLASAAATRAGPPEIEIADATDPPPEAAQRTGRGDFMRLGHRLATPPSGEINRFPVHCNLGNLHTVKQVCRLVGNTQNHPDGSGMAGFEEPLQPIGVDVNLHVSTLQSLGKSRRDPRR